MKTVLPLDQAILFGRKAEGTLTNEEVTAYSAGTPGDGLAARLPAQVADILLSHGKIADPRRADGAREVLWIAEQDWVYRIQLPDTPPAGADALHLHFKGLDTLADVYVGGRKVASHSDIYLPLRVALAPSDAGKVVLVHFHSPHRWIKAQPTPGHWNGRVHKNRLLRKPHEDFNSFNGAFPYFTPIGIHDAVLLEGVHRAEFTEVLVRAEVEPVGPIGYVHGSFKTASAIAGRSTVSASLVDPLGTVVAELPPQEVVSDSGSFSLKVPKPALWWPRGYGAQPLYRLELRLHRDGAVVDSVVRSLGFRHIELQGDFALRVNGIPVKLWGANFVPLEQFTHVWPRDRARKLLDLAENANLVTLRLWGPGAPYGADLFDECDRRGILLWSEFYHTWGMYPDHTDYLELCRLEAEHQVKSLMHHPSVFMWCGGNEVHMGSELSQPGKELLGRRLFTEIYPAVCAKLDPSRYYHIDSPTGGAFANDPDVGDTHGYTHFWFVRGCLHPVILTENARWSPPQIRTLKRYIPEPHVFWPEGFRSRIAHRRAAPSGPGSPSKGLNNDGFVDSRDIHEDGLLPPSWQLLGKDGNVTNRRAGPIQAFYDTGDSPEGLIHRIGSAHALFMRREIERLRQGRPAHQAHLPRRTQGHYWWRLNGTWPLIESELIDYLLEPKMAYYATRRAQAPILLSFEFGDRIHLWATNDTPNAVEGTVEVRLQPMGGGAPAQTLRRLTTIPAGESVVVCNLDSFGMFRRELAIVATLTDTSGKLLAGSSDFIEDECNLTFPDAAITLERVDEDTVQAISPVFARCVEILGTSPEGDGFGWAFEDNFFDLLPDVAQRIRLLGSHRKGRLTAKSFFGTQVAHLELT